MLKLNVGRPSCARLTPLSVPSYPLSSLSGVLGLSSEVFLPVQPDLFSISEQSLSNRPRGTPFVRPIKRRMEVASVVRPVESRNRGASCRRKRNSLPTKKATVCKPDSRSEVFDRQSMNCPAGPRQKRGERRKRRTRHPWILNIHLQPQFSISKSPHQPSPFSPPGSLSGQLPLGSITSPRAEDVIAPMEKNVDRKVRRYCFDRGRFSRRIVPSANEQPHKDVLISFSSRRELERVSNEGVRTRHRTTNVKPQAKQPKPQPAKTRRPATRYTPHPRAQVRPKRGQTPFQSGRASQGLKTCLVQRSP